MSFIIKNNNRKNGGQPSGKSIVDKPDRDFEEADKLLAQLEKMEQEKKKNQDLSSKAKQVIQSDKEALKKMEDEKTDKIKGENGKTSDDSAAHQEQKKGNSGKNKNSKNGVNKGEKESQKKAANQGKIESQKKAADQGKNDNKKATDQGKNESKKTADQRKNESQKKGENGDKNSKEKEKQNNAVNKTDNTDNNTVAEAQNSKKANTDNQIDKDNSKNKTVVNGEKNSKNSSKKSNNTNTKNNKNSNDKNNNSKSKSAQNSINDNLLHATKLRKKQPNKLHEDGELNIKKLFLNSKKYMVIGTTVVVLSIVMLAALALDRKKTESSPEYIKITKSTSKFLDDVNTDEMIETVYGYNEALIDGDVERARTYLYNCDDITDEEILKQSEEAKLYYDLIGTSFEITDCYLQDGMQTNEYIAYMKFQIKIKSIETPAVGIFTYYLIDDIEEEDVTTDAGDDSVTTVSEKSSAKDEESTDQKSTDDAQTDEADEEARTDSQTTSGTQNDGATETAIQETTQSGEDKAAKIKHNYKLYIELNNPKTDVYKYVTRMQKADNVVKLFDAVNKELEEACEKDANLKAIVDALQNNDANISGRVNEQESSSKDASKEQETETTTKEGQDSTQEATKETTSEAAQENTSDQTAD